MDKSLMSGEMSGIIGACHLLARSAGQAGLGGLQGRGRIETGDP